MLLFNVYLIASGVLTALSAFLIGFDEPLRLLFLLLIFPGALLTFLVLHFFLGCLWSLVIKNCPFPEKPSKFYSYFSLSSIDIIDRVAGVKTEGFDISALPKTPFLLVSNHISKFDPMTTAVCLGLRHPSVFLSKMSNFGIPNGPFIKKAGYLPIDREDPRKAMEAVNGAVKRLHQGYVVGVYPEGTRSKTGELGPFSEGIFLIAKKADVPVVVVSVKGTKQIAKNFPKRRTKIRITLCGIIDKETVSSLRSGNISQIAREMIEKNL